MKIVKKMPSHSKLIKNEYFLVFIIIIIILSILFFDIAFLNKTFSSSSFIDGTMPYGSFGYIGEKILSITVYDGGAPTWHHEPALYYASNIFKLWQIPLWNPDIALGSPFAADMQSAVFYPLNYFIFLSSQNNFPAISDFVILFRLFIAGFFTYCFMREISVNKFASFFSAIAFMLTGYFIVFINMAHLNVEVLIPVLMFFFERLIKTPNFKNSIFASIIVLFAILGGMPESTLFAFFLVGVYVIFRTFCDYKEKRDFALIKTKFFWIIFAFIIGILLSSFLILPFLEFMNISYAPLHGGQNLVTGVNDQPFSFDTISIIIPHFFGWITSDWNTTDQNLIIPYIGMIVSFFAISAISRKEKTFYISIFFSGFAIFYLLKKYGFPIIRLIGYLPLFNVSIFWKYLCPAVRIFYGSSRRNWTSKYFQSQQKTSNCTICRYLCINWHFFLSLIIKLL